MSESKEVFGFGRSQEAASPTDGDGVVAPTTLWIVTASSGEYSDRSEWAVCAHWTEGAAHAYVDRWTPLIREAESRYHGWSGDYTPEYDAMEAALMAPFAELGIKSPSRLDTTLYVESIPLLGTPTPPSDGEGGAQRSEAEPTEHKAATSPAVEAEVAELVAAMRARAASGRDLASTCELLTQAADLLSRLASEKARLEAQDARSLDEINLWAERQKEVGDLYAAERARAERAEAERDDFLAIANARAAEISRLEAKEVGVRSERDKAEADLSALQQRVAEGQPTDEGRRAKTENLLTQERK